MAIEVMARVEHEGRTLVALRRDGAVELSLGQVPLLSSRALGTERAFGELARRVAHRDASHVMVGGLGFGGTAEGALGVLAGDARVTVVEKLAPLPRLLAGPLSEVASPSLGDPRLSVVVGDVRDVLRAAPDASVDALLLDVDNGPSWASFRTNAALYDAAGLALARSKLTAGGVLAVWSGYAADAFVGALRRAGFAPETVPLFEGGVLRARAYVGTRA